MNIKDTVKFCFTWALPGGAWLEDSKGERNWFSARLIDKELGQGFFEHNVKRQGWMTGCWIDTECEPDADMGRMEHDDCGDN